jgi:hypothetical protein
MDAYEVFWKMKVLWMQNCTKISGNNSTPANMNVIVGDKKIIDVIYNEKLKAIEVITEDNNDQEKI